jgi:hypothetical protein
MSRKAKTPKPATRVAELYTLPTLLPADWPAIVAAQQCPLLKRKCLKNRKSEAAVTIGACTTVRLHAWASTSFRTGATGRLRRRGGSRGTTAR